MNAGPLMLLDNASKEIDQAELSQQLSALLASCQLPIADLGQVPIFLVDVSDGELQGAVGLEIYRPFALLRSLAVDETSRGAGLGTALVQAAETQAAEAGVEEVFLLTTTAPRFFERLGYVATSRAEAPEVIRSTREFSALCPDTAALMAKRLR